MEISGPNISEMDEISEPDLLHLWRSGPLIWRSGSKVAPTLGRSGRLGPLIFGGRAHLYLEVGHTYIWRSGSFLEVGLTFIWEIAVFSLSFIL